MHSISKGQLGRCTMKNPTVATPSNTIKRVSYILRERVLVD